MELLRTLGNDILTTEKLQTVLCDCESVIISSPLTYLSENSDDLDPLSSAMFLVENRNLDVPDINPPTGQNGFFRPTREASKMDCGFFFLQ
ncbi:integrase catalytic domain-containing protein, partial [Trichonephila clavipes]